MSYPFTAVVSNEYNTPYAGVNATCAEITSTRKGNGRNYFFNFGNFILTIFRIDILRQERYNQTNGTDIWFHKSKKCHRVADFFLEEEKK